MLQINCQTDRNLKNLILSANLLEKKKWLTAKKKSFLMLAACLFCSVILLTAIKRKVKRLSADTEIGAFGRHIEN